MKSRKMVSVAMITSGVGALLVSEGLALGKGERGNGGMRLAPGCALRSKRGGGYVGYQLQVPPNGPASGVNMETRRLLLNLGFFICHICWSEIGQLSVL